MADDAFEYVFTVPLHDIDAAGIMFFGHLFRHAHDAYEAFMTAIGFPLDGIIREGRWRLPLVHAEADYRIPLRHGDATGVEVRPAKVGNSSFTLDYRFATCEKGICATARTVHVHSRPDGLATAPLPLELREALVARSKDHSEDGPPP
jgi:1,4-dihydroxy-2-naphthoyl-CoA hydrolase